MKRLSVDGLGRRLLTERWGRTVMTTAGIMLGVALFTGSLLTTSTATRGLARFAEEANGQADVVASPPGGLLSSIAAPVSSHLPESAVPLLAGDPDVSTAVGMVGLASLFDGPGGRTEQKLNFRFAATLIGADFAQARSIFVIDLAEGREPAEGADELVVPASVADEIGAGVGDQVTVTTTSGLVPVTVVGVLADRGIGRVDGLGFTSLSTAQRYADMPGQVSQIGITLRGGVDVDAWMADRQPSLPSGMTLSTSAQVMGNWKGLIGALTGALSGLGASLLAAAAFLIYLTLSMSVVERTQLYGTLLALGATRRQIRRIVLAEALTVGVVGAGIGVLLGVGVAGGLLRASGRLLDMLADAPLVVSPVVLAAGAIVGVAVTVASALIPARRAAATDPVAAITASAADESSASGSWLVGLVIFGLGAAALFLSGLTMVAVGLICVGIGAVRLLPHLIRPLARTLGPALRRLSPGGGQVAIQHLVAERTRSAHTLALVMIVMALSFAISAVYVGLTSSLDRELTAALGNDLAVTGASTLPESFLTELDNVPGVAGVTGTRDSTSSFTTDKGNGSVYVRTIDPDTYFDVANFGFTNGTADDVISAFQSATQSVLLPESTAGRLGLDVGDTITLDTLEGPVPFAIVATAHINNIPAVFYVGEDSGIRWFGSGGIRTAFVSVEPGVEPEVVRTRIQDTLGDTATFIVSTHAELKADARAQISGGIAGFFVLLLLAGLVGTFGLANTMVVSVHKRYREIGVLRAVGARRRQIRGMAIVESLTLVTVALVLAVPLGLLISRPLLNTVQAQIGDISIHYQTPWITIPVLAVVGLLVAFISAIWPANRAAHLDIDAALRFE